MIDIFLCPRITPASTELHTEIAVKEQSRVLIENYIVHHVQEPEPASDQVVSNNNRSTIQAMSFEKVDGVSKQNRIVDFYLHRPSLKVQIQAGRLKWSDALRCHHAL